METLRDLWGDLWKDKPLLITLGVALVAVIYIIYKSNSSNNQPLSSSEIAPTSSGTGGMGTFVEESYYVGPVTTTTNITNPIASGVSGTTAATTPVSSTPPPVTGGVPTPPIQTNKGVKSVTVQKWPAQNSTLWGIAQSVYGNGALWPKIYNANKAKIGANPNVIQPGWVLTIP